MAVGAGGALLADCLTGFAAWAPASAIIKALTVLCFSKKGCKIISPRNLAALVPAAALCAGGYYLYESLLYGNFVAPLSSIPASIVQSVASAIVFAVVGHIFDKMKIKSKISGGSYQ